jgi:hypothetical protein
MTDRSWVFPDVAGRDLSGREYRLPVELPARVSVVVIAFKRWHQAQVDDWISRLVLEGIPHSPQGRVDLDRVVLELPVISGRYQLARRFIDGGMAASIRDPEVLARTITLYGSVDGLCEPLGITSREDVSVRVVTRDGTVAWGTTGQVNGQDVASLLAALADLEKAQGRRP